MNTLAVDGLVAGYQVHPVVNGVSFSVTPGSIFGLIGPNGSGKTTLFKCLCALMKPWRGRVFLGDENISLMPRKKLARKAAFIPQIHSAPFPYTVEEYVLMGRYPHRGRMMPFTAADRRIVEETLEMLDLAEVRTQLIQRLSGGEMQRVFLACGLAQKPEVLLMDEPTTHLDIGHQMRLLDLLKELSHTSGLTVLLILHDLNLASLYCTSIALLDNGLIRAKGSPEEVLIRENIEQVYRAQVEVGRDPISLKPHIFFVSGQKKHEGSGSRH
jgi:iron complex transport system ATP-binding protein